MAERRMVANIIVESDAFLDMPLSAQALYFHLNQRADDEGFVGSPYAVLRMCGAAKDDLSILLSKRFVLGFESGVIVIKHWLINNYIRADRAKPTTYVEEKSTLTLDNKSAYIEITKTECQSFDRQVTDKCPSNVSQLPVSCPSNVRVGKDRLGKDNNTLSLTARAYARERGKDLGAGEYENVFLSAEEAQDLLDGRDRAGADKSVFTEYIEKLSYHIKRYGRDRDSDHHAILVKWMSEDGVYESESLI